ncbi:hypothetical protein J3459_007375 [Metarhizium acridum]|nr:hypothetical protein J3459_007375 [Metarhizium acridum]
MASSFAEAPASLQSQASEPRNTQPSAGNKNQYTPSCGTDPFNLSHRRDEAVSPAVEHTETPAGSIATVSHYQSSDFSDPRRRPILWCRLQHH